MVLLMGAINALLPYNCTKKSPLTIAAVNLILWDTNLFYSYVTLSSTWSAQLSYVKLSNSLTGLFIKL